MSCNVYTPSAWVYEPPPEPDYPYHDRTVRVTHCGRLCLGRRKINLSNVFAGQMVGIREVADQIWLVSFMDYDLGFFDQEQGRVEPAPNPFAPMTESDDKIEIDFKKRMPGPDAVRMFFSFVKRATPDWFTWLEWVLILGAFQFLYVVTKSIVALVIVGLSTVALSLYFFGYFFGFFMRLRFEGLPFTQTPKRAAVVSFIFAGLLSLVKWQTSMTLSLALASIEWRSITPYAGKEPAEDSESTTAKSRVPVGAATKESKTRRAEDASSQHPPARSPPPSP